MNESIHSSSDVQSCYIGEGTRVWQFCVILEGARIGKACNICSHCLIENDVVVGDRVTVKCGVQLWDGLRIADDVFIGPNVTFTNDLSPRSKKHPISYIKTTLMKGASIGANATICAGNIIGNYALIGAGSVVTKDVGNNELWVGNPAKKIGFISDQGEILDLSLNSKTSENKYRWHNQKLIND